MSRRHAWLVLVLVMGPLGFPTSGIAQEGRRSAVSLGTAENASALSRGLDAAVMNPAILGLPHRPGMAVRILSGSVEGGLHPIRLRDLAAVQGETLPHALRESWVGRVESTGAWRGAGSVSATLLAARIGRVAFDAGSTARIRGSMTPDATELLFFGNSGRDGSGRSFAVGDSRFDGAAYTTAGISAGRPLELDPSGTVSIGARLSYTLGHAVVHGADRGSSFTDFPFSMDLRFPVVETSGEGGWVAGRGFGIDIGSAWEREDWTWSLAATDLVNTFSWTPDRLRFRAGTAYYDRGESEADLDPRPLGDAPPEIMEGIEGLSFGPGLALSVAHRFRPDFVLTAETRRRFGGELSGRPAFHLGVGLEHRATPSVTWRGGSALVSHGYQVGLGLELGRQTLSVGGAALLMDDAYGRRILGSVALSAGSGVGSLWPGTP